MRRRAPAGRQQATIPVFSTPPLESCGRLLDHPAYMREMTPAHIELRAKARRYFTNERLGEWVSSPPGFIGRETWFELSRAGFLGTSLPEQLEGRGLGTLGSMILTEAVAELDDVGLGLALHVQCEVAPYWIARAPSEGLRGLLPELLSGRALACVCYTEPTGRHDATAERDGDELVVTGTKSYVVNGHGADLFLVVLTLDGALGTVLVERNRPGVRVLKLHDKLGTRAVDSATIEFDHVRVPATNIVSRPGVEQLAHWNHVLTRDRFFIAVLACLVHERLLRELRAYGLRRTVGGRPLLDWPENRHVVARASCDQRLMRAGILDAYRKLDGRRNPVREAAALKWFCVERATEWSRQCCELEGGAGYMMDGRFLRADAQLRGLRMAGGSQMTMLMIVDHYLRAAAGLARKGSYGNWSGGTESVSASRGWLSMAPAAERRGSQTGPVYAEFCKAVDRWCNRVAVGAGEEAISYRTLGQRVEELRRRLAADVGGRRRVGFFLGNTIDWVVAYYAALGAGHVPFLVDASFKASELEQVRDGCGVDAFVTDSATAARFPIDAAGSTLLGQGTLTLVDVGPARDPHPMLDDTVTCRFTSGTTGSPRCLEFTGRAVVAAARSWADGTDLAQDDRVLCLAALTNGLAFNTSLLATFLVGAELNLHPGMPTAAHVSEIVERRSITRLVAFPLLYRLLARSPRLGPGSLSNLRCAISAGAPLEAEVRARFVDRFGVRFVDYYGVAETGPCSFETDPEHRTGLGSALPGVDLRIEGDGRGPGQVLVRSGSMTSRYLNAPGGFEARLDPGGYFRSGDIGELRNGRLFLTGRTSTFINVAGRKVDPTEVSDLVIGLRGVEDAIAVAGEDAYGQTVVQLMVVRSGDVTRGEVLAFMRPRLASYKLPGHISFVDAIPRTGTGKPRVALVAEMLSATAKPPTTEDDSAP